MYENEIKAKIYAFFASFDPTEKNECSLIINFTLKSFSHLITSENAHTPMGSGQEKKHF